MADKHNIFHNIFQVPFVFNVIREILDGGQLKYLKKFINEDNLLLEVGCGTGYFSSLSKKYVGIDYNKKYIAYNRKMYPSKSFVYGDVSDVSISSSYDVALLANTLHHLNDVEVTTILKKMKSKSKKIIVHDVVPPRNALQKLFYWLDRGEYFRTPKEQIKLIESVGLEVREHSFFSRIPCVYKHMTIIAI